MNNKIDFSNIKIDIVTFSQIVNIPNSCGIFTCYMLSLIFDIKFYINEFKNLYPLGLTDKDIKSYAAKNGLKYLCVPGGDGYYDFGLVDFHILCENGIVMTLSGTNLSNNSPHSSVISNVQGGYFTQYFSNPNNCITKFSEVQNIYPVFYYKNGVNIHDFVEFRRI